MGNEGDFRCSGTYGRLLSGDVASPGAPSSLYSSSPEIGEKGS